jgi:hypothetical protein
MLVDGLTDAGRLADWLTCCHKGRRLDCQEDYRHHIGSPEDYELIISKFISSYRGRVWYHKNKSKPLFLD